ncbi:ribosome biogenesis protein SLX9-domain-containing protein [Russula earlei]|uniref:Ribosome biogenesis protein SLX9-domain-containing protein n=1 Tax=Russula earlei TaxID=71964 RepID=A0ACC0U1E8_9AGAM|nr:ribosome biogenesis protein SLX9-domain-containing protein [Russula earlei]
MPKVRSRRSISRAHTTSVKLVDRPFAIQDNAVQHIDVGTLKDASAEELLHSVNESASSEQAPNKKERRILKHELFIQRLEASRAPYSKSHARRLKRRERERLGAVGDLTSLRAALPSVASLAEAAADGGGARSAGKKAIDAAATASTSSAAIAGEGVLDDDGAASPKFVAKSNSSATATITPDARVAPQSTRPGMIGEGRGNPLSRSQRRRALKAERFRQPLIRSNPEFAANPFATIQTHAQNTLVPHFSTTQQRKQ